MIAADEFIVAFRRHLLKLLIPSLSDARQRLHDELAGFNGHENFFLFTQRKRFENRLWDAHPARIANFNNSTSDFAGHLISPNLL